MLAHSLYPFDFTNRRVFNDDEQIDHRRSVRNQSIKPCSFIEDFVNPVPCCRIGRPSFLFNLSDDDVPLVNYCVRIRIYIHIYVYCNFLHRIFDIVFFCFDCFFKVISLR